MTDKERIAALASTFDALQSRLDRLEAARVGTGTTSSIEFKFEGLEDRISKLEDRLGVGPVQTAASPGTTSCALHEPGLT